MKKVFEKRFRHSGDGLDVVADVSAVVVVNIGTEGTGAAVTTRRSFRVTREDGKTEVTETEE